MTPPPANHPGPGRSPRRTALRLLALAGIGGAIAAIAACSPLRLFDTLVPQDGAGAEVARGLAYGPGARQRLDVYAPRARTTAPAPVIVFMYGGSWNSGTRTGYGFVGRALAARGFVTVIPDYRVLPAAQYPDFLADGAAAVRWTQAHAAQYGGDPARIVLMGHSAGAYNVAMLALDPRWLGADRRAIRGWIGLAGPYDFLPLDPGVAQTTFGAVADPASTQPITYAAPGAPPAFLATGARDTTVLPRNSDALAAALARLGDSVERKSYPALGHVGLITALAVPFRGRAPVLADAVAFARRVTAPH